MNSQAILGTIHNALNANIAFLDEAAQYTASYCNMLKIFIRNYNSIPMEVPNINKKIPIFLRVEQEQMIENPEPTLTSSWKKIATAIFCNKPIVSILENIENNLTVRINELKAKYSGKIGQIEQSIQNSVEDLNNVEQQYQLLYQEYEKLCQSMEKFHGNPSQKDKYDKLKFKFKGTQKAAVDKLVELNQKILEYNLSIEKILSEYENTEKEKFDDVYSIIFNFCKTLKSISEINKKITDSVSTEVSTINSQKDVDQFVDEPALQKIPSKITLSRKGSISGSLSSTEAILIIEENMGKPSSARPKKRSSIQLGSLKRLKKTSTQNRIQRKSEVIHIDAHHKSDILLIDPQQKEEVKKNENQQVETQKTEIAQNNDNQLVQTRHIEFQLDNQQNTEPQTTEQKQEEQKQQNTEPQTIEQKQEEQNQQNIESTTEQKQEEQNQQNIEPTIEQKQEEQNQPSTEPQTEQKQEEQNQPSTEPQTEQKQEEQNQPNAEPTTEQKQEEQNQPNTEPQTEQKHEEQNQPNTEPQTEQKHEEQNQPNTEPQTEQKHEEQNQPNAEPTTEQKPEEQNQQSTEQNKPLPQDQNQQNQEQKIPLNQASSNQVIPNEKLVKFPSYSTDSGTENFLPSNSIDEASSTDDIIESEGSTELESTFFEITKMFTFDIHKYLSPEEIFNLDLNNYDAVLTEDSPPFKKGDEVTVLLNESHKTLTVVGHDGQKATVEPNKVQKTFERKIMRMQSQFEDGELEVEVGEYVLVVNEREEFSKCLSSYREEGIILSSKLAPYEPPK